MLEKGIDVTEKQIEILGRLLEMEVKGDDPSLTKQEKNRLMKVMHKNKMIPSGWSYQMAEAIGCYRDTLIKADEKLIDLIYSQLFS